MDFFNKLDNSHEKLSRGQLTANSTVESLKSNNGTNF